MQLEVGGTHVGSCEKGARGREQGVGKNRLSYTVNYIRGDKRADAVQLKGTGRKEKKNNTTVPPFMFLFI